MTPLPPRTPSAGAVAVVGMAGRFPGAASPAQLWDVAVTGRDVITRAPRPEAAAQPPGPGDAVRAGLPRPASRHVAAAGVLPGYETFDAEFFGIPASEADRLDPQQRLLLECAWEALTDAGCVPGRFDGAIGVFAGVGTVGYGSEGPAATASGDQAHVLATEKDFAATRIAHRLDLRGPAVTVQTACSTSLVAVHLGVQSLLTGDSDAVLAGAAAVRLPHHDGYLYRPGGIFSPDGHCRSFSAQGRGTVPGSGVGMVLLKRLSDAVADGDHVYAVVLGSAVNNDGRAKQSFSAPSSSGQLDVITTAHRRAGIDPATVGYVEAHGTATPLGDQVEFDALTRAFRSVPPGACALGSVKANIGHLDVAAGVTGLMKAVLALYHRRIPPALHGQAPHPGLGLAGSPFRLPPDAEPWHAPDGPRRAAVSSFGVGGTNAHVVLEEAPPPAPPRTHDRRCHLLLLSERSPAALRATAGALAERLPQVPLPALSSTLVSGRVFQRHRWSTVVASTAAAHDALRILADPANGIGERAARVRPAALVIPDATALDARRLRILAREEPAFAELLDELRQTTSADITGLLRSSSAGKQSRPLAPDVALTASLALSRLLALWGLAPAAVSGLGTGALAAACLAGVLTAEEAVRLADVRGSSEAGPPHENTVREALASIRPRPPRLPCRSDLTGADLTAAQATDPEYWIARALAGPPPVHQDDSRLLPGHDGPRLFLGPASMAPPPPRTEGSRPRGESARDPLLPCLAEPQDARGHAWHLLSAVGRAWQEGAEVNPETLDSPPHRHIPLPSRPFLRRRHWAVADGPLTARPPTARTDGDRTDGGKEDGTGGGTAQDGGPSAASARSSDSAPIGETIRLPGAVTRRPDNAQDTLVQRIATMWATALGLADVAADDDFTALGGDSLLALDLAETIGEALDHSFPPELLLDSRTPRGLAGAILPTADPNTAPTSAPTGSARSTRSTRSTRSAAKSLALLATRSPAPPPGAVPLFLVHPVGGSALVYRDLARSLAPAVPLYGFTAPGLPGSEDEPFTDLYEMARAYTEELLAAHPSGQFWMGGSSFGGVVAHEMTGLLTGRGRPPAGTFLLDSPWPSWISEEEASPATQAEQVRELPAGVRPRILRARLDHLAALRAHSPTSHHGHTVYVRAAARDDTDGRAPEEGWRKVLPHLTLAVSPGGHESMLAAPHARLLALTLTRHIQRGT
ncbi:beta-ketoacyl synthase N-terminal-like domain-containing protein [Streptomyces sp. NPDC091278]|uniref:beta-ketoacyl synthase N-terminal-like domain-containing protein n=1 Tax=Streptomyces sp. NPDC091278 TaxID=3155301 RepID=UPI00344BD6F3